MCGKQFRQTKFDSILTDKQMQLMKAVIPYIDNDIGLMLGLYIKVLEMQRLQTNFYLLNSDFNLTSMLDDLMEFMDEADKETFETMKMMFEFMSESDNEDILNNCMNMFGL